MSRIKVSNRTIDYKIPEEPEMIRIRNRALEHLGFSEKVHPGTMEWE